MSAIARALQVLVAAGFLGAAVAAYRDWLVWRGRARAHLAAAVGLLALVSILGILAATQSGTSARLVIDLEVAAFLGVGYSLFLYRHDLQPVPAAVLVGLAALCVAALALTVAVVTLPLASIAVQLLNGVLVLVAWSACVLEPTIRLWRLSASRPAVQRARLRALSLAYGGIIVVTTVETLAYSASNAPTAQVALEAFSLLLVPVLIVAFAPPSWLRHVWRQSEEQAYGAAMRDLMVEATDPAGLAHRTVEWAVRLVGGAGGMMVGTDGSVLARVEVEDEQVEALRRALVEGVDRGTSAIAHTSRTSIVIPTRTEQGTGGLAVVADSLSPVFGRDEVARLEQYVAASAAALERVTLMDSLRSREEEVRLLNLGLERRVQERTEQLEASNRELEAFSYTVSHDLRAPLRAVDGFARILLEEYEPYLPEEGKRYLHLIGSNAEDMGNLIDALLTFSRLSRAPLRRQPVAPTEVARHAVRVHQSLLDGRDVDFRVQEDMPLAQSDPVLLEEVMANLIGNAVKFSRDRPAAVVEVGMRPATEGDEAAYFVRDNGIGFDMRYAEKIFGVFQRLHRGHDYEGTGAGLAIVQRIIKRHGGRVWADAIPGQGATFYFTLGEPRHDE